MNESQQRVRDRTHKASVLLVDDQPEHILALSELLKEDYDLQSSTGGAEALEIAAGESPPDLILLDIQMPDMDGYEVCRRLKANDRTRGIPVVFVTSGYTHTDEEKGLNLGAVDYLTKPFNSGIVRVRVRQQIERGQMERALRRSEARYRMLFENMNAGFALHEALFDENGRPTDYRFLEMNPMFEKLTGDRAEDFIGRTTRELRPDATEQYWIDIYGQVAATGKPLSLRHYSSEVGKHFDLYAFSPEKGRFAVFFVDVTEQRALQRQIEEQAENRRILLDNIQTQVWHLTDDHTYGAVNKAHAEFNGVQIEDLAFKDMYDIFPENIVEVCRQANTEVFAAGKPVRTEEWVPHVSGERRLISVLKSPRLRADGTVEYVVCSAEDITERKQAEEALRESESRFKSIIAVSNTGAWEYHRDKDYLWCSPEYFTMLGYDPSEFIMDGSANLAQTWIDLIHPDDRARASAHFAQYLADGSVGMYENYFRMKHRDGGWVWIWSRGQTLRDGEGRLTQKTVGTHINITERKQYEEKLLFSERTYKEIFDNINDALFIHDIATGAIVDVNNTMLEMYGYERQEIAELGVADLSASMEPYSNERAGQLIKEAASGETVVFEWLNRKKNGELFYSENVLRFVNIAGVDRIMAVVRDITDRKQAEETLRESEAKLSALFGSMTEMVVMHELVFDEAGTPVNYRITDCNVAFSRITGIRREEAVGKLASEVYGAPVPPYLEEFARVGITGEPYHYETYFAPMDKYFAISVVSPGKNRFATITTDISEAKRIQAVIDAKNKELEQLVYIASHDLRSPLVNVDGFSREIDYSIKDLTALLDGGADTEALEKALRTEFPGMEKSIGRIRTSTAQMDKLLNGLLHLSRLGRAALQIDDIDMNDCLARLRESFAFVMKEKGVELRVEKLPACRGDAVQLTQVFSNLIDNAVKYRDPDRPLVITVSGAMEADRAVYRVTDNGVGIADNHLEHVFELFHRLEPDKTEGEGLGLTVARQTISRLYGDIKVESEVGKGSVFIVGLPPARYKGNVSEIQS